MIRWKRVLELHPANWKGPAGRATVTGVPAHRTIYNNTTLKYRRKRMALNLGIYRLSYRLPRVSGFALSTCARFRRNLSTAACSSATRNYRMLTSPFRERGTTIISSFSALAMTHELNVWLYLPSSPISRVLALWVGDTDAVALATGKTPYLSPFGLIPSSYLVFHVPRSHPPVFQWIRHPVIPSQ